MVRRNLYSEARLSTQIQVCATALFFRSTLPRYTLLRQHGFRFRLDMPEASTLLYSVAEDFYHIDTVPLSAYKARGVAPMIYYAEERETGYAVIGKGKHRSANIDLTENQADRRAHELVGEGA